ncbi:hypothetical protein [Gordonia alkanivorans]|uniref:hypothetical protein n=1 Tax=Gordonia alkanivorans TaxID=84096 RepID=UPI0004B3093A|nr:hypothetical protein [Gordonia alkanivorans]
MTKQQLSQVEMARLLRAIAKPVRAAAEAGMSRELITALVEYTVNGAIANAPRNTVPSTPLPTQAPTAPIITTRTATPERSVSDHHNVPDFRQRTKHLPAGGDW